MMSLCKYLLALFSANFCFSVTTAQTCGPARYYEAQTDNRMYIRSPRYPSSYPTSTTCEWTITAPPGYMVELSFVTFDTGGILESGSCSDLSTDVLKIYEAMYLRGLYCKSYLPANVYSTTGGSLYLKFTSDEYPSGRKGFKIRYSAVKPKPDSTICSPFNTFSQNNNIQLSASGHIESPLYGSKYPSNMQCTWVITVADGYKIKLTFSDFMLEEHSDCSADSPSDDDQLQIRDGRYSYSTSLKTLCGQSLPSAVYSSGRYMWVRFKSNSNNYNTRGSTGFKAKYEENYIIPTRTDSDSISIHHELVTLLIVGVVVSLVCIFCIYIAYKIRTTHHDNVRDPGVAQTTLTYNRQTSGSPASHPTVHYSPAPQSSYPPPSSGYPPPTQDSNQQPPAGSYSMLNTGDAGDTTQPSAPIRDHPSGTFLNDPPPTYPEAVPDVPPPPYPGIVSQNPLPETPV